LGRIVGYTECRNLLFQLKPILGKPVIKNFIQHNARYLSNLSTTFISQAVSALSILFLTTKLVNELGTTQFSHYGVLLNMILFSAIFDLGFNIGLLRKLIHNNLNNLALINTIFFFFLGTLLFLAPLFWMIFTIGFVKVEGNTLFLSLFVSILIVQNFLAFFFDTIIQSANKIYVGKLIRIFKTSVEFICLWLVSQNGSIVLLLLTSVLINIIYLGFLFLYARKEFQFQLSWAHYSWSHLVEHIQYSFWYFQSALAGSLVCYAQIILSSNFADSISTTRYLFITRFFDIIRTGLTNFILVLFPSLSKLQANQDWSLIDQTFNKIMLRYILMAIVVITGVMILGQYFFVWWSGYEDQNTLLAFKLYGIFLGLLLVENVPTVFLSALKHNKWPSVVASIQGVLGLILAYLLLPEYGIVGAIAASCIAFLLTNGWFNYFYCKSVIQKHLNKSTID